MKMENIIRIFAGAVVFVTALLGFFHSPWWLIATMFVGANLFQFGVTGFCPLALILKRLGVKECECS